MDDGVEAFEVANPEVAEIELPSGYLRKRVVELAVRKPAGIDADDLVAVRSQNPCQHATDVTLVSSD
jgi:hypothetical protein